MLCNLASFDIMVIFLLQSSDGLDYRHAMFGLKTGALSACKFVGMCGGQRQTLGISIALQLVSEAGSPQTLNSALSYRGSHVGYSAQQAFIKVLGIKTLVHKCSWQGPYLLSDPSAQPRSRVLESAYRGRSITPQEVSQRFRF